MHTTQSSNKKTQNKSGAGSASIPARPYFITVTLYKNNKVLDKYSSHKKSRILRFLQMKNLAELNFDYGLCKVSYIPRKDVWNKFRFTDLDSFRKAVDQDTEPELLKFVHKGKWD